MSKKDQQTLSWDAFQALGNPENAPEMPEDNPNQEIDKGAQVVRIHLEKKGRGGKSVSIVKGIDADKDYLKDLAKSLKQLCGVGGSLKDGEIIIQGEHRDKIMTYLKEDGYKNVKKVGG